jgi:isocitrate/isopropylmalate dehydrogenase
MIPGDGIGPEISESVEKIFEAAKVDKNALKDDDNCIVSN